MESYFPFEELPKDIRRMIYDYLPESSYEPLLYREHGLYYERVKLPVSLLRVNKIFYDEVEACLRHEFEITPMNLLCLCKHDGSELDCQTPDALSYVSRLIRMVDLGQTYDNFSGQTGQAHAAALSKQTLQIPRGVFGNVVNHAFHPKSPWPIQNAALNDFYQSSLFKLRHKPGLEIKVQYYLKDPLILAGETTNKLKAHMSYCRVDSLQLQQHHPFVFTLLVQDTSSQCQL